MYKMLAIDIDDTLINDDKQLTEGTREALRVAMQKNVFVTLATGRMYASAKQLADQLHLHIPIITYQGALVKDSASGETLYQRTVPIEACRFVYDYCARHHVHLQAYIDDVLYVQRDHEHVQAYAALSNVPYIVEPNFHLLSTQPSIKLLMIDDPDRLDRIATDFYEYIGHSVHITKSKPHFLEITHPEGTKGHAVSHLAKRLGIRLSEVIAIGDSWNDREMLEVAGLGVAMENAVNDLKQIADFITHSNNNDGVKHVIDKFILQLV